MAKKITTKATTKVTSTKGTAAKTEKVKKPGIGVTAIGFLKAGKTAQETLELVNKAFPDNATSIACIYWYASKEGIKLQRPAKKKKVVKVLTAAQAQKQRMADKAARAAKRPGANLPPVVEEAKPATPVVVKKAAKDKVSARRPAATAS